MSLLSALPCAREGRPADLLVHLARWRRGDRADARTDRPGRRRDRLRLDLGDGPLLPDPRRRSSRGADARGHDRPRVHGGALEARTSRVDGRRRPLPQRGAMGEGDDDARRPVRRSRLARDRGGMEPGGIPGARFPIPTTGRTVRDARGDAPDRPRDVAGRAGVGGGIQWTPVPGPAPPYLAPVDLASATADHGRWWWREEDAPAG